MAISHMDTCKEIWVCVLFWELNPPFQRIPGLLVHFSIFFSLFFSLTCCLILSSYFSYFIICKIRQQYFCKVFPWSGKESIYPKHSIEIFSASYRDILHRSVSKLCLWNCFKCCFIWKAFKKWELEPKPLEVRWSLLNSLLQALDVILLLEQFPDSYLWIYNHHLFSGKARTGISYHSGGWILFDRCGHWALI